MQPCRNKSDDFESVTAKLKDIYRAAPKFGTNCDFDLVFHGSLVISSNNILSLLHNLTSLICKAQYWAPHV